MLNRREALVAGAVALATPMSALAAITKPADTERLANGDVDITWSAPGPVQVRMSTSPDGPFKTIAQGARQTWKGEAPVMPRPYFRLTGPAGADETAERLLPLKGGRNFRDLGGYRTADGRIVRWGQLYRSGSMVNLTAEDYRYLQALNVAVICDFRDVHEREREPTKWSGLKMFARDYEMDLTNLRQAADGKTLTAEQMRDNMAKRYEDMPYEHAASYRRMFAELVEGRTPLAFNCSAGKDRTGIAAALLLTTLGVPRQTVMADYALTDKYLPIAMPNSAVMGATGASTGLLNLDTIASDLRRPMIRADPIYLERAFATMTKREGSVEGFVQKQCGVTPAGVRQMRAKLLKRV